MRFRDWCLAGGLAFATIAVAHAQSVGLNLPRQVEAGAAFSIPTTGSGKAVLYIIGFGQVLRQDVQLGQAVSFAPGVLHNAGRYLAVLVSDSSKDQGVFDVMPASQVENVSFLAKPSRLAVSLHNGISGAVYVFDTYQNLILTPKPVSFQLATGSGAAQSRSATTEYGRAWIQLDSASKEGAAQFTARVGDVSNTRIIQQVPGDPCGLKMTARPAGRNVALQTEPLRDCTGNAVPDGTIVTFTEVYDGGQTTVDVPLKRGIAQTELPAHPGARISAATGVVLGNEIRLGGQS